MSTFLRRKVVANRGKEYVYVQLVCNQRIKGKMVQRVLQNLGREDQLDLEEVDRIVNALAPLTKNSIVLKGPDEIDFESARSYGDVFVVEQLWCRLKLDEIMRSLYQDPREQLDIEALARCMVTNRLLDPVSKLAATRWVDRDVDLAGVDPNLDVNDLYRTMDRIGFNKSKIEDHIFHRLTDLHCADVTLVFYDTTLVHFEGEGMGRLVRFSRKNKRLEKKEILICVVMSRDGFPIAFEVLPGNTVDVTTVVRMAQRLSRRFMVRDCVFIGDRGMFSNENLDELENRLKYKSLIGAPLDRVVVRDKVLARPGRYHVLQKNLLVKEVDVDGQRYILGFNPEEARREKSRRLYLLATLQKKIDALPRAKDPEKARSKILADTKRSKYLWKPPRPKKNQKDMVNKKEDDKGSPSRPRQPYPLRIDRDKVRKAARYDGKHVIRTNVPIETLNRDEVARAYRDLQRLEYCFKHLKSAAIWVGPVYHWKDRRIRAHVLVCIIALVIERYLQHLLDNAGLDLEAPRALEELSAIRSTVVDIQGRTYRYRNEPRPLGQQILQACQVRLPPRVQEETPCPPK